MTVLEQVRSCCAWPFATVNTFRSNKHVAPAIASGQPPPPHPPAALRSKLAVGPRQHGPSSNKMARITSDCDAMQRRDRRPGVLELAHRPEQRRAPAYSCTPLWIIPTAAVSFILLRRALLTSPPLILLHASAPARLSIITMHPSTVSIGSSKACSIRPHESPPSHGRRVAVGLHGDSNDDVPLRSLELNRRGSAARGAGAKLRLLCLLRVVIGAARAAVLLVQAAVQGHMGCVDKRRGRRQSLGQRQRWRRGAPPPLAAPRLPEESARSQLFERRLAQPTLARPVVVS